MQIELRTIKVRDLVEGYEDSKSNGVVGYGGKLNIRPPYQREFRYDEKQKRAVINTILKGFPLNIMYWSVAGNDAYEMIDGQQRTLSICEYYKHGFNILNDIGGEIYFHNLSDADKKTFMSYELTVYFCSGTDKEKLDWFRIINIAGERLLDQELRNAVYSGPFVSDARRYFSKRDCPAYAKGKEYLLGKPIEQAFLETALKWAARKDKLKSIDEYMAVHQHDPNANNLWEYFNQVITWVRTTFPYYRSEMKGLDWGAMYDEFGGNIYDANDLEKRVASLMEDDEVVKKPGIYHYVLSGDLRDLNFRVFAKKQKREAYERQKGICSICHKHFELEEMEADHIIPWIQGGTTVSDNCQMLCRKCNRTKGGK